MKSSLAVALGHVVASSPLEALIMRGDLGSNGINCIPGPMMASFFPVRRSDGESFIVPHADRHTQPFVVPGSTALVCSD